MSKRLVTILMIASTAILCRGGRIAYLDMTPLEGRQIIESVGGQPLDIHGNFAPEPKAGAAGTALRFDGYTTFVSGHPGRIGAASIAEMTVSLWIAPETYPIVEVDMESTKKIMVAGTLDHTAKTGWGVMLGKNGNYSFDFYSSGSLGTVAAADSLPCYQWSNIVVAIGNKRVNIYRNGVQANSRAVRCNSIDNADSEFYIGKGPEESKSGVFNINTFNGLIDDIEIFDTALPPSDFADKSPENDPDFTIPASRFADSPMRPVFHGMPAAAWTNECHGMTYSDGRYHLFFQKNANGPFMTRLHWGHISSENLYDWREEKIALMPGRSFDIKGCWSGCVFTDDVLTGGKPNILYTGVDYVKACIVQAEPADGTLLDWAPKYDYPVIANVPGGMSDDFRDPYFFRNGDDAFIVVGTAKGGIGAATLHKYNPRSGIWSNTGTIFFQGSNANEAGTFWEMPTVTKIGDRWLVTTTPQNTSRGVSTLYWTGRINSDGTFAPDDSSPKNVELNGFARDGFGMLSPTVFQHDGKTIALGIVPDKLSSQANHDLGYAHTYSLPREWSIDSEGNLCQKPFSGLTDLRTEGGFAKTDFILDGNLDIEGVGGRTIELYGEFTVGSGQCGFTLLDDGLSSVKVYYDASTNEIVVDARGVDRLINDSGIFDGYYHSTLPRKPAMGETIKLNVFFDHSILDIFVDETWASSVRIFANMKSAENVTACTTASTPVKALRAWNLDATHGSSAIETVFSSDDEPTIIPGAGTLTYDNVTPPAILSVYNLWGLKVGEESLGCKWGTLDMPLKGFHIVNITTRRGSTTKKVFF